ncbi:MAG TPA: hypothetical protein VMP42_09775 [Actinomycetota bacterium]|nr:hypothetical protein [Actinomycetota bacterium]
MRMRLAALAAALLLAACTGDAPDPDPTPTDTSAERPSSPAELTIVEPEPGTVHPPDDVPVRLELENAEIVEEVSTDLAGDQGHIHLVLDGETVTLLGGLDENLAELVEGGIEPGMHILEAEFVAADHGFFLPRVITTVTFQVE